jgi:hypothetical protein
VTGRPQPPADILQTARSIAAAQRPCGALPWPDGHTDPWDHVECAMALSACGLTIPARLAYKWLRDTQRQDGSWPRATGGQNAAAPDEIADHGAESHHAAYVAVGVWHEFLVTADRKFAERMWPAVRAAVEWTLALQAPRGEVAWERDAAGAPGDFALLSGCASILHGLRCALFLADLIGEPQPDWELAAVQLGHAITWHPEAFADKSRFAMDWYYPVLGGALHGASAAGRLTREWDTFVVQGLGVRCVSDQPWVTVAETCELVIALDACGMREQALEVFATVARQRHADGSYWTGWQYVNQAQFPVERSGWTAAAVVLAADALHGFSNGAGIFRATAGSTVGSTVGSTAGIAAGSPGPGFRPPVNPVACGCAAADALIAHHF